MKFNFRKISAIASSVLLTGMTLGVAAAASFPAPYSSGTASTVGIVSGSGAGVNDGVATSSISSYLATKVSGGGTITGENALLDKSTDHLNMGDAINAVHTSVDEDELPILLADGTFTASDSDTYDYEQKITLGTTTLTHFRDSEYEDLLGLSERTPVVGYKITSGTVVLNYTLDFTSDAESDIASSELEDFEGSIIHLLGKDYYVSDFDVNTSATNFGKVTLLDTADTAIVEEGETVTVTVGGSSYEVSISTLTTTQARLVVNGVTTNELSEGSTQQLASGAYLGIKDIFQRDVSGVVGKVEFSIGVGKLEITSDADIVMNDATISGVQGTFRMGTATSSTNAKIDKIYITWTAEDDQFITENSELVMPGFGGIKFSMTDFVRPEEEVIKIQKDGDKSIELVIPIKDGDAHLNILHANVTGDFDAIGKDTDERLATSSNSTLKYKLRHKSATYDKYFVASYNTTTDSETYLLSATMTEDLTAGRNTTTIKNVLTGDECKDKAATDTCDFGSVSLTINVVGRSSSEKWIDLEAGTNVNFNTAFTKGGLLVYLPYTAGNASSADLLKPGAINVTYSGGENYTETWDDDVTLVGHGHDTFWLSMEGENKDDTLFAGDTFNFTIDDTTGENLQVSQVNGAGSGGSARTGIQGAGVELADTGTYETYIIDPTAPRILHYTTPDEDWAEVYYASGDSESYANLHIASSTATTSAGGSMVFKDSETGWRDRNVILIGGSCINSATATALGVSSGTCDAAFTSATGVGSGKYLIQSVDGAFTAGKIALVVAGYDKADTAAAVDRLVNQPSTIDTTAGSKYIGVVGVSGTSTISKIA